MTHEEPVFLFGFSRGALIARHFAAWLDKLCIAVAYLGLWDTVDSTIEPGGDTPFSGIYQTVADGGFVLYFIL